MELSGLLFILVTVAFDAYGSSYASPTSSISSSGGSASNLGGCPQLAQDCNFDCLTTDSKGCLKCSCTESSSGLTSGQTGVSSSANLAGCPPLPKDCNFDCLAVGDNGCIICTCRVGNSNGQSSTNTSQTLVSGPASNGNGCPIFPNNCRQECVYVDSKFCPVCDCGSAASGKIGFNGCPPFPTNCRSDCVSVDSAGCPLCSCVDGSNSGSSSLQPGSNNPASPENINNCPAFSSSCTAECTTVNSNGCPVCLCAITSAPSGSFPSTKTNLSTGSVTTTSSPSTVCPVFDSAQCNPSCLKLDRNGCVSCDCAGAGITSILTTTNPVSLQRNRTETSPTAGQTGTGSGSLIGTGCPTFDVSCPAGCASVDDKGCLLCSCQATTKDPGSQTTAAPGNMNNCPEFDISCPSGCAKIDANGCLSCSCSASLQGQESRSTVSLGSGNVNNCPTFDVSCPTSCTEVDANGCLSCTCTGSVGKLGISSTVSPGSGKVNSCPTFDVSCATQCTKIDTHGCLTCTCTGIVKTSTTPSTDGNIVRTTVGPLSPDNSCPLFDTATCETACIAIDVHGCLTCRCSATQKPTTQPVPETTTSTFAQITLQLTSTTQLQTAGTCPPVRCSPTCNNVVVLDKDNCPICRCHMTE